MAALNARPHHIMTGFQRLSTATIISTYALLILGGIVRVTESGLGCPD